MKAPLAAMIVTLSNCLALASGAGVSISNALQTRPVADSAHFEVGIAPAAAFSFTVDGAADTPCTGSFISNSGYFITAAHCFPTLYSQWKTQGFASRSDDWQNQIGQEFQIIMQPNTKIAQPVNVALKIAYLGESYIVPDQLPLNITQQEIQKNRFDVIIGKIATPLHTKPVCLKVRSSASQNGESIAILSSRYQGMPQGPSLSGSAGSSLGKIFSFDEFQTLNLHLYGQGFVPNLPANDIYSTVSVFNGISGSPAVDVKGQLIGITIYGIDLNSTGGTYFSGLLPVVDAQEKIKQELGNRTEKTFFSCD